MKKFFYDVETTGLDHRKHSIHQISAGIEIDDKVVEVVDIKVRPYEKAEITDEALKVGGITKEDLLSRDKSFTEGYEQILALLNTYVDQYNKRDKFFLIGYNNLHFDNDFFRAMFELHDNNYFGSYFFSGSMDVYALAAEYLAERRYRMRDFKQGTVAEELGIEVDDSKLHDALYDVGLTREIYKIVTGREEEI